METTALKPQSPMPIAQNHAVQGNQGAYGDVDAAGEHDAGHAAGDADQARAGTQNVEERLHTGEVFVGVGDAAAGVEQNKENNGNEHQQGVTIDGTAAALDGIGGRFHTRATSFLAALAALCFLNQALTGGAWMATMRITMTALNTGVTSVDTPRLYMVVVMAWMV